MHSAEFAQLLSWLAKLADNGSIQLHLVNFAADCCLTRVVVVRVRVRTVEILVRPWRDADCPRSADVVVDFEKFQIAVENLNTSVLTVGYINIAFRIRRDRVRCIELPRLGSSGPDLLNETAILVVLRD